MERMRLPVLGVIHLMAAMAVLLSVLHLKVFQVIRAVLLEVVVVEDMRMMLSGKVRLTLARVGAVPGRI